jgi:hypothetical protein
LENKIATVVKLYCFVKGEVVMQIPQQVKTSSLEKMRIDFMDGYHDFHQNEEVNKKKNDNRRKCEARRSIEAYQEKKKLRAQLIDWWDEV